MTDHIKINEVVPRDGFQMEKGFIPTNEKIKLIDKLSNVGLNKIEVTSFVSPKAIPQLKDANEVMEGIKKNPEVDYVVLVPNLKGAERALLTQVDEMNLVLSASHVHNLANVRKTHDESFMEFTKIIDYVKGTGVKVNGSIATTFGCPFLGNISEEKIFEIIERYVELGVNSITLADTTGMANPNQVRELSTKVIKRWPGLSITLHFHNTRGLGLANVVAAVEAGMTQFDAAIGGIGGCPFAPGASGNISTEDLVHMLEVMDFNHSVDLNKLIQIAETLPGIVGHDVPGQIIKSGHVYNLHPIPANIN